MSVKPLTFTSGLGAVAEHGQQSPVRDSVWCRVKNVTEWDVILLITSHGHVVDAILWGKSSVHSVSESRKDYLSMSNDLNLSVNISLSISVW